MHQTRKSYHLFLQWLLLFGLLLFIGWLLWTHGLIHSALRTDPSHITLIILLLFSLASFHCAMRAIHLSREQHFLDQIVLYAANSAPGPDNRLDWSGELIPARDSICGRFIAGSTTSICPHPTNQNSPDTQLLAQVMAERARGQHEAGWFICGLLIKLGLLGTVIGFLFMLAPVAELESFDLSDIQGLLQRMTTGMGVALNTTLMGLSCSMLLGIQYLMLDRAADRLVADAVAFREEN